MLRQLQTKKLLQVESLLDAPGVRIVGEDSHITAAAWSNRPNIAR